MPTRKSKTATELIPEKIAPLVMSIRHEKVLLDSDLAELYGVTTSALNQAVKRNLSRFPDDFMFQLTEKESETTTSLRSQIVILNGDDEDKPVSKRGRHRKYLPNAFTEQGVAMLSSVLRSERAVEVNIAIMRTFVQLRRLMDSNRDLSRKIENLEEKYSEHDHQFEVVFDAIKTLIQADETAKKKTKRRIGFHSD
ncbi:MAG: hypothetical protein ACI8UO_002747 [Verrucomicrobiales bacterium]|jgi:hypothetical protein